MSDLLIANGLETGLISTTLTQTEFDALSVVAGGTFQAGTGTNVRSGSSYSLQTATGGTSGVAYAEWDWGSNEATLYSHLCVMFPTVPSAITYFASVYDTTPAVIGDLGVNASGNWIFKNAGDATTYTSTGFVVLANVWNRIELKLFSDAAAGTIDWKTNGVLEPGISGLTAKNTKPGNTCRKLRVGVTVAQGSAGTRYIDDVIVRNGGWVGNGFVRRLWAFGNAASGQNWTIVDGGSTSYKTQQDAPWSASATTDMIKSSTANQEERYTLEAIGTTTGMTILGVVPMLRQRRGVAGSAAGVAVNIRSGVTDGTASASLDSGGTTFQTYRGVVQDTDPATGVAWTLSALNAAVLRFVHDAGANECDINASFVYAAYSNTTGIQPDGLLRAASVQTPRIGVKIDSNVERYRRRGRVRHRNVFN